MRDLTNLNKLEQYLKGHDIPYERIDNDDKPLDEDHPHILISFERHQIYVPNRYEAEWDAICHRGSYGASDGLLEIMGTIVNPFAGDTVEGFLTAEDVIGRIEAKMEVEHYEV